MATNCINKNPLQRSGTSQQKRVMQALSPDFVRVDERDHADLILFAKEYAAYLNYYNLDQQKEGDWTSIMKMDVSVTLATISKEKIQHYFTYIKYLYDSIQKPDTTEADLKKYYSSIFSFLTSLVYRIDAEYQTLPQDFGYTEYTRNAISSHFANAYAALLAYYTGSGLMGMIDTNISYFGEKPPIPVSPAGVLQATPLSSIIWSPTDTANAPIDGITPTERIKNTVQHNIFKGTVESLLKSYAALIMNAGKWLDKTLQDFPTHSPHYALYLTFIKLFRVAQSNLNSFTDRHLKYYYKEVLQLKTKAAEPDKTHLVFELQKNIEQALLAKDTLFKAGKNAAGQEMVYALADDIVVNKGTVKSIKSIFVQKNTTATPAYKTIYSAPTANSSDGKGGAITTTDKSWEPFGDAKTTGKADIGFAIAHQLLFLKEGNRSILVVFALENSASASIRTVTEHFSAKITGEKDWLDVSVGGAFFFDQYLVLKIDLAADIAAAVAYSEAIHKEGYNTALPVLKVFVKNTGEATNLVEELDSLTIKELGLWVLALGIKDIAIQNEAGPLDPAKPFALFSERPHLGSSFIVGSKEVFLKNSFAEVTAALTIEWDKTDKLENDTTAYPLRTTTYLDRYLTGKTIKTSYLQSGQWIANDGTQTLFAKQATTVDSKNYATPLTQSVVLKLPKGNFDLDFTANEQFKAASRNGFMKIDLTGPSDFGHGDYMQRLATYAKTGSGTAPEEPYTPSVKSVSLSYLAASVIPVNGTDATSLSDKNGMFCHITPFGNAVQHRSILGSTAQISVVPSFDNEGEIYIGIDQFKESQSLQLLFKVSEGSADPAYDEQSIQWSYMSANNQWTAFDKYSVEDKTNNLTKTGIIGFAFPSTATSSNSVMGEKLFWIRGAVAAKTAAICNIIEILPQAATAILYDHYKSGIAYTDILPASTIAKFLVSNSSVKSIKQPYESFGGKTAEEDSTFYNRVSERLRHKNRSVTMWDYERMVLQQFPQIYKVKCINHSRYISESSSGDNELAPGHVLVVPIPDLRNMAAIDPLRPQTSLGTLTDIEDYLRQYISPFVRLQVKNAVFEEIQLDFKVKYLTDDGAYYSNLLISEIEQFLSPWAFGGTREIEFGGKISKSVLLNFVEERSYVDYVTCFKMIHIVGGKESGDVEEAVATTSRSVFVSYGGDADKGKPKHIIDYVNHDCNC